MTHNAPAGDSETVLVTGGTCYVGSWVIIELLRRGYRVRTTVRRLSRADDVRAAVAAGLGEAAGERECFGGVIFRSIAWRRSRRFQACGW